MMASGIQVVRDHLVEPGRRLRQRRPALRALAGMLAGALALAVATPAVHAQPAPAKPLRFVVPLGPGSGADTMTRFIARRYEVLTGQPAVVENRPGGSLVVGTMSVVSAPPDGRSILYITPSPVVINPIVEKDLPYDPQRDLRPVVSATRAAAVMVVSSASRFKTFADVIAAAKAAPGTISYANYGYFYRFAAMALEQQAGVTFNHVLYKGAAQANTDLIGGQIDVHTFDVGGAVPLIKSGALRPLAVTGKTRHPYLPDVPTIAELGYP